MLNQPRISRVEGRGPRHYTVEGYDEPFPSVTTVLSVISKPALIPWSRRVALDSVKTSLNQRVGGMAMLTHEWVNAIIEEARLRPDEERDRAADLGTRSHVIIDAIIQGHEVETPPELESVVEGFLAWQNGSGLEIQLSEQMVFSARHHYAGAMDAVAYRDGNLVALDWKTANGIYPESALQLAAYAKALGEMTGEQVGEAWVVRFGKKTPEFEAKRVSDIDVAFDAFIAALQLWKGMRKAGSLLVAP